MLGTAAALAWTETQREDRASGTEDSPSADADRRRKGIGIEQERKDLRARA